jgi:FecR protein
MPIVQPIGGQRGSWAPLLLITLFWINGCQSLATQSEGAVGSDTGWRIARQAGAASLRSPGQSFWHRAISGVRIAPGSQVATFDGSRLELASAGDKVTASGPSRFTLPDTEHNGVRVRQDAGTLRYSVQSAPKRRFEVKTPHFSTVVKGTTFLVSIDRTSSEVFVDEGRVLILDVDGEPLAELTAGQIGRMAAQPGATLEVSTARDPSFERSTGPGAELEPSAHGHTTFSQTTGVTRDSLGAPISEAGEPTAELSLLERIGGVLGDLAAQISTGDALTSEGVDLNDDRGGGAREQESWSKAYNRVDGGRGDENGRGKGKGNGKGKGKGKGKSKGKGKGEGRGKGHGHGRGKGAGGGANIILDRDDTGYLIGWNERL